MTLKAGDMLGLPSTDFNPLLSETVIVKEDSDNS